VSAEKKIGAYICKGCGLGERLDCKELATIAKRDGKAGVVREHAFLCNAEGVAMIRNDIAAEGVNRVVIAACSRRAKTEAFNFDNVAIGRVNLREGVIWVRPDSDEARETTQEMAADYVRMGCAEVKFMNIADTNPAAAGNDNILVVGGGVTGMTAAIEAAAAGFHLQLSGHTHGGQFLPWNFFVRLQQPFTAGLHRLGSLWVYTSRGTGYWGPPKRLGAPSEITYLRLVPAELARP